MLDVLYLVASIGFLFWIGRNTLYWVFKIQNQGYSIKKLRYSISVFGSGEHGFLSPFSLLKWIVLFLYPLVIFNEEYGVFYHVIIALLYGGELLMVFREILNFSYYKQALSKKSFSLILITIAIAVLLFIFPPIDKFLWLVIVDRMLVFIVTFIVLLSLLPEEFYRDYQVSLVLRKLTSHNPTTFLLIGGKETEFQKLLLSTVLSKKGSVLLTPPRSGKAEIIQTILHKLSSHEYLIADFSSGGLEEIESVVSFLTPDTTVIHSLKPFVIGAPGKNSSKIRSSIESILSIGKMYIYKDDDLLRELVHKKKKHVIFYSEKKGKVQIRDSSYTKESMSFSVSNEDKAVEITSPTIFSSAPSAVLPVLGILLGHGISEEEMQRAIHKITLPESNARASKRNGVYLLNNSGDVDPESLWGFAEYLQLFQKKKMLVLDADFFSHIPTKAACLALGKKLSDMYDYVFFTPSMGMKLLRSGIKEGNTSCFVLTASPQKIASYLQEITEKGDLIVFQGVKSAECFASLGSIKKTRG